MKDGISIIEAEGKGMGREKERRRDEGREIGREDYGKEER